MINANELRIGNWVTVGPHSNFQVKVINEKNKFEPIPLSPQILEEFGFTHEWTDGFIKGRLDREGQYFIRFNEEGYSFAWEFCRNESVEIRYLHQLQNLYFALTKKELEINFEGRKEK